jgi:hypothetical protein
MSVHAIQMSFGGMPPAFAMAAAIRAAAAFTSRPG